jgi:hypothetical protein
MWRRLKARLHPDAGGSEALFVFATAVEESLEEGIGRSCSDCRRGSRREEAEPRIVHEDGRIPFPTSVNFAALTGRALQYEAGDYSRILALLKNCWPAEHLAHEEQRGASYKQLAAIGHIVGMSKRERGEWYRLAESIPLSQRHAGHIIAAAKKAGTA